MSALDAAGFYTAINLIILMVLALRVSLQRRTAKVSLGHGDDEPLRRRIRVHANAAEWMPGALVGLVILALLDAPTLLIHGLGATLVVGRGLHAYGLGGSSESSFGRFTGTVLTMLVYIGLALALFWRAIS